jgi:hypothetical protein
MPIFRRSFEKHFLSMVPWEIEKNLSRLATQWSDGVNAAIRNIQVEAEKSVKDQISTVESLLSQAPSESEGIKSALEEIDAQISVVRLLSGSSQSNLDRLHSDTVHIDRENS